MITHPTAARTWALRAAALLGALLLAACTATRAPVAANAPTTARPLAQESGAAKPTGGIFRANGGILLFEDRKPRMVGDILTIQINENLNASQSANSSTEKKDSVTATLPKVSGILGHGGLNGMNLTAGGDNVFNGTGQTASTGVFTGTITVTVVEVLGNGNLLISGEKQIGIRQNSEVLKLSGVIDPAFIQPGNLISSTLVADLRLDYRGGGNVEDAQTQGWLGRAFNSMMPF
jgi:flagellar L-ring protein precursor FlgH